MDGFVRARRTAISDNPFIARLRRYIDLSVAEVDSLQALIDNELTARKRSDLVVDGYQFGKLGFVKEGFAARYKLLRNGKRQIVDVVLPGDVVGLPNSFLDCATFSVVALSDVKLQTCSLDAFVALCCRHPKFALALSWCAVHDATKYAEHIVDIGRRTSIERLARFLIEIHLRLGAVGLADECGFELPFSQEVLSDALGLSVPHLNRTLARLRTDGLIAVNDRYVEFSDIKAVQLLAHFQPIDLARIPIAVEAAAV